jgi:hypothetical protein
LSKVFLENKAFSDAAITAVLEPEISLISLKENNFHDKLFCENPFVTKATVRHLRIFSLYSRSY